MNKFQNKLIFFSYILMINLLFISSATTLALTSSQAIRFFQLNDQHNIQFLDIRGYQQTQNYTCGPAIIMSLLRYYGKFNDQQMNQETEMRIANEMGTTEAEGTNEEQMVQWLNHHGFNAKLYRNGSIRELRRNLAKGIPVLVDWIDWGGHWVAVAGYDFAGNVNNLSHDTIYFADPAAHFDNLKTVHGLTFINPERFANMWLNSKNQKHIYIVAEPK